MVLSITEQPRAEQPRLRLRAAEEPREAGDDQRSEGDLLASAVAGRPMHLAELSAGPTYTDGSTIHLAPAPPGERAAAIIAQALMIPAGSLRRDVISKLRARPVIAQRYFLLEVARGTEHFEGALPGWFTTLVRELIPGPRSTSTRDSLAIAQSRNSVSTAAEFLGTVRPTRELMRNAAADPTSAAASSPQKFTSKDTDIEAADLDDDTEHSMILELFKNPLGGGSSFLMKLFGSAMDLKFGKSEGASGDEASVGEAIYDPNAQHSGLTLAGVTPTLTLQAWGAEASGYPEWDFAKQQYRQRWCTVRHYDPRPPDGEHGLPELRPELRRLATLLARDFVRRRAQPFGPEVDLDALVERTVRRRAGQEVSDKVYAARLRQRHSLSLMLLIDCSGSAKARPANRSVHDEQILLISILLELLHSIGIRVAAYGFNTLGRGDVRFLRVKGFDDPYNASARKRLHGLQPNHFTRLGAAVRHATHLVERDAGTPQQCLLVVSDGFPYDDGNYENDYADFDTQKALDEARERGIGSACVSIGSAVAADRLQRVFGSSNHLADPTTAGAMRKVMDLLVQTVCSTG